MSDIFNLSIGIEKERVDPYTLQMIDQLFPGHHGLQFLAGMLQHASVKQLALPELGLPEATDVAIITVQSLRILARLIGFSYDATEKYIVVLSQLHLLYKKRERRQIILHFPLGRCQLPPPEVLDQIQEMRQASQIPRYRPKVRSFANQVKRRFVLLQKKDQLPASCTAPTTDLADHQILMNDIRHILLQEVDPEIGSRLFSKIEGVVRYRCSLLTSSLSDRMSDIEEGKDSREGKLQRNKSPFLGTMVGSESQKSYQQSLLSEKDDSFSSRTSQERRLFCPEGDFEGMTPHQQGLLSEKDDSFSSRTSQERRLFCPEGDSFEASAEHQSLLFRAKGDSEREVSEQERRLLGLKGDFVLSSAKKSPFGPEKGDFQGIGSDVSFNDNVTTISNDILREGYDSDNDVAASTQQKDHYSSGEAAKVGRQLALYLEKTPQNTGGFVNKCKQYSCTVIRASLIDMLVHAAFPQVDQADERGRPRNRASWFHNACKKYGGNPGTRIPAFVEVWLKTDLSWEEIEGQLGEAALRYKHSMIAGSSTADLVRQWLRGEIDQNVLDEALQTNTLSHETPSQKAPQSFTPVSLTANGTPLIVSQPVAQEQKTWMDEDEAQMLAEEILRDAGPFGVSKAVVKQEHGVSVVALTWLGTTFAMKTPQQWRAHFENVRPEFERRMQKEGERNGSTR